jgi:hypothetical protein
MEASANSAVEALRNQRAAMDRHIQGNAPQGPQRLMADQRQPPPHPPTHLQRRAVW